MALRVPAGRGRQRALHLERDAQLLEGSAELGDVVAVDQVVGVGVEQMDGRPSQHERHVVLAGHHAHADAHGLERAARRSGIDADEHEDGLRVGHGRRVS